LPEKITFHLWLLVLLSADRKEATRKGFSREYHFRNVSSWSKANHLVQWIFHQRGDRFTCCLCFVYPDNFTPCVQETAAVVNGWFAVVSQNSPQMNRPHVTTWPLLLSRVMFMVRGWSD